MEYKVTDTDLISLADEIRKKGSLSSPLTWPSDFISSIQNFSVFEDRAFLDEMTEGRIGAVKLRFETASIIVSGAFRGGQEFDSAEGENVVSIMDNAFCGKGIYDGWDHALDVVSFPACTTIGNYAFWNRNYLKYIYFPICVSIGSEAFFNCRKLFSAVFPACKTIGSGAFSMSSRTSLRPSSTNLSIIDFPVCTDIGQQAFYYCTRISEAFFPACTNVGFGAFEGCDMLLRASFPLCTSIPGDLFRGCHNLLQADFPLCSTINAGAFSRCNKLPEISFPLCTTINEEAFVACHALTSVEFPTCTVIRSSAFRLCGSLATASFPACVSIDHFAFYNDESLSQFYLLGPNVATLGVDVFGGTPIVDSSYLGYYGSIYVPSSLADTYRAAPNWSVYADRIVGI